MAVYIGYAFTTSTIGAFLLLIPHRVAGARAAVADGDDVAACHRRYAGRGAGHFGDGDGLGQLAAPMLLTGAMAYFTADAAPVRFPGAAFVVAAIFGLLAILMLRRLPRVTQTADQMPPSVTA